MCVTVSIAGTCTSHKPQTKQSCATLMSNKTSTTTKLKHLQPASRTIKHKRQLLLNAVLFHTVMKNIVTTPTSRSTSRTLTQVKTDFGKPLRRSNGTYYTLHHAHASPKKNRGEKRDKKVCTTRSRDDNTSLTSSLQRSTRDTTEMNTPAAGECPPKLKCSRRDV